MRRMQPAPTGDTEEEKPERPALLSAFERLRRKLHGISGSILGNPSEADDALQEAFCRLWPKRDQLNGEDEAAALITTTVKNISIDTLRHRKHESSADADCMADSLPDESDKASEAEEKFRRVEEILKSELTPLQREILTRRDYKGEDFNSIASSLNMQPTAVRMQLSRARKAVRECYNAGLPR